MQLTAGETTHADIGIVWRVRESSPRLRYILRVLCEVWYRIPYQIEEEREKGFQRVPTGWKVIAYGVDSEAADVRLPYSGFIARTGTEFVLPLWDEKGFFPGAGDFSWDLPAMAFYVLTGYALYEWPYGYDEWGVYAYHRSPFYEAPFWGEPFVLRRWQELLERLGIRLPPPPFQWEVGWDIDHLYLWKGRSGWRWWLGGVRHGDLIHRLRVRLGREKDPYDTMPLIISGFPPTHSRFFFLLSNKHWRDSLLSPDHPDLRRWIRTLVEKGYAIGIHPSFQSREQPALISLEKALLEAYAGQPVIQSRQHYLRFWMPHTFQVLAEAGIREEFSMAFPRRSGFLLGTTLPVPFYRVDEERELPLWLWSPALMERALLDTEAPQKLQEEIQRLLKVGKEVGGRIHFIWHNSTWSHLPLRSFIG